MATGSAAITLGSLSLAAAGSKGATGSAAITLAPLTLQASSQAPNTGSAVITLGRLGLHAIGSKGTDRVSLREAALGAIATRLSAQLGVPVERGRRSMIGKDEELPRLVVKMAGHSEEDGDEFQTIRMRCEALIEGYCVADTDAALEAALNDLHGRCANSLLGAEIAIADASHTIWVEGRGFEPDAALLAGADEAVGGFTWTIGFDLRASYEAGPFVAAA